MRKPYDRDYIVITENFGMLPLVRMAQIYERIQI